MIPPEKGPAFVEALPVAKFHGVGPKTAEKMNRLGIHTGADLKAQSLEFLEQYFGKAGTYYYAIARGQDDRRVVPNRPRKSVGSETTFMQDLGRPAEIEEGIASVLEDVWSYCERTGAAGRTVTVKIKYADFQIVTRSRTLSEPVSSRESAGTDQHRAGAQHLPTGKAGAPAGRVAAQPARSGRKRPTRRR